MTTALTVPHVKKYSKTISINTGMAIVVQLMITFRLIFPWSRGAYWWGVERSGLTGREEEGGVGGWVAQLTLGRLTIADDQA